MQTATNSPAYDAEAEALSAAHKILLELARERRRRLAQDAKDRSRPETVAQHEGEENK